MDKRCPRQLPAHPETWCPLAVQRLKALRHAGRELTEEEEAALPGCPWSINHQMANYCFFSFMEKFSHEEKSPSEMEMAHFLNLPVDCIKKTEKKALVKLRNTDAIKEVKEMYDDGEAIVEEKHFDVEWEIPK